MIKRNGGYLGRDPRAAYGALLLLSALSIPWTPLLGQTGSAVGTVLSARTGEPLGGVQISLEIVGQGETGLGALSRHDGRFLIINVPAGQYVLRAQLLGYGVETKVVEILPNQSAVADFRLEPEAISLSEIVVTGVVGATQRTKLPFDVTQVRVADLPVPAVTAAQSLQGKVAGVQVVSTGGMPGGTPDILLRGATMLNATGRSQDPLFIVDDVILGADMVDMSALDVQSIEVIKGAAAASLYGSRAASGVLHIRTRRGAEMGNDQVRYTLRSEFGGSTLGRRPSNYLQTRHPWAMTVDSLGEPAFMDADGSPCEYLECETLTYAGQLAGDGEPNQWNSVQSNRYPGKNYDQMARFFTNGPFLQHHLTAEGRSGRTNFLLSGSHLSQDGIIRFMPGFSRTNLRLNLDQAVHRDLKVHTSAFYSRSTQPTEGMGWMTLAVNGLRGVPPNVDLLAPDPDNPDELIVYIDRNQGTNPLYNLKVTDEQRWRSRFLGSATLRYTPRDWLEVEGNFSFDRSDIQEDRLVPTGYESFEAWLSLGYLYLRKSTTEALNGSVTTTARWNPTERIRTTTQLRYLLENADYQWNWTDGTEFAVSEVPVLSNLNQETLWARSGLERIRSDGYFLITNFDIFDRYVVDALIRRDGSSLFGADERRQWYYRLGAAWRVSQEDFFNLPFVDELKLRYSVGTAGGRPRFNAQYETFDLVAGRAVPTTLGNKKLKPEFSTEHEAGLELSVFDFRGMLSLTYARTTTQNQILEVPQADYTGYITQWRNAGTLESRSWEATLDLRLLERRELSWRAKLLFDATRTEITELHVPDYQYGYGGFFYARKGEEIGTFYGSKAAKSCEDLPTGTSCDGFTVNDDGFLVWIGEGGSFADPRWGTVGPEVAGGTVMWGTPFMGYCTDPETGEETDFCPVGNTQPDYNLGLSTTLSWKGLSVYALLSRSAGFEVEYIDGIWAMGARDQVGIPPEKQKPTGYYGFGAQDGSGLLMSERAVDGSFTKLRELSVSYRFGPEVLGRVPLLRGATSLSLKLSGQNLYTWSKYRGSDPEVGTSGGSVGSAVLTRVDRRGYPNIRMFTGAVELVF